MTVLDTSALIALLFGERGAEKVEAVMRAGSANSDRGIGGVSA
jgi:PIN domain nuclease of toxin-antitoxin system